MSYDVAITFHVDFLNSKYVYCEVSVLRVITHVVSVYTLTCICPLEQNYHNVYVLLSLGCS